MRPQAVFRAAYAIGASTLRHPVDFVRYIARQAVVYERYRLVRRDAIDQVVDSVVEQRLRPFLESPPTRLLPQRTADDIAAKDVRGDERFLGTGDGSELPEHEQRVVARIVTDRRPIAAFEIGTYRGRTTRLLASCSPAATIHTLDLPPDNMLEGGCFREWNPGLIGTQFSADHVVRSRILQHFGDSRTFDFTPFWGRMDMVFVDASHAYEAVLSDSRQAFRMIRPGGLIIWDDYHPVHGIGVMKALAELSDEQPIAWIRGTRLAIHYANVLTDD